MFVVRFDGVLTVLSAGVECGIGSCPCPHAAMWKVVEVVLVFVCLAFKTDVAIGAEDVAVATEQSQPLDDIPEVKAHKE